MKKKILLLLSMCMTFLCLTGCDDKNEYDMIHIYRVNCELLDTHTTDIKIKDGYFYYKHEKFIVDENTIGLTIYFSKNAEGAWE